jgi:hypothetical protein
VKKLRVSVLILIVSAGVFFSCNNIKPPAVIGSAYDGPDRVKFTIDGDWSGYTISNYCVVIYGETTDTYYSIEKTFDSPLMVSGRTYTIRAEISPSWKSSDRILVYGWNGVLGGTEFTTPK